MTKQDKIILAKGAAVLLITAYSWLTWWVLPDVWVANLVPLKKTADLLPKEGSAIIFLKGAKIESYRVIESIEVGWDGIMPISILGIIIGVISGCLLGYRLGYEKGTPDREFIDNAHKAYDRTKDLAGKVELKERAAEKKMEEADRLWSKSLQKSENAAKELKESKQKMEEAKELMDTAQKKLREAAAKEKDLTKAKAKIQRLESKIARYEEEKND